jgi:hypothetical protein
MSASSLPIPRDPSRIEDYADLLACVLDGRQARYLSVPITTGWRFIKWYSEHGRHLDPKSEQYRQEHRAAVIVPNCEAAKRSLMDLRSLGGTVVIEPTALERPDWDQDQYRYFWGKVIERFVTEVVFLDGWEYSSGCAYEFLHALRSGAHCLREDGKALERDSGLTLIKRAIGQMRTLFVATKFLETIAAELEADAKRLADMGPAGTAHDLAAAARTARAPLFKDDVLDRLAVVGNVAQFVSFAPQLKQRYARIHDFRANHLFANPQEAIAALLEKSPDETVNVRSFHPQKPKGWPLEYGLRRVEDVMSVLRQRSAMGAYTIVNETVDISDGGVSGVAMGEIIEFSPNDTPKCVDKPGVCSLARHLGVRILQQVYGFRPAIHFEPTLRVEFSIHPKRRGLRRDHTIIWELEEVGSTQLQVALRWPNKFSQLLGDKAFGLLIADALGLPVPRATLLSRRVAPFGLGRQTGTQEIWMRTCPEVRAPGRYPTTFGWTDPFAILAELERVPGAPDEVRIASVLAQEGAEAKYSGSLLPPSSPGGEPHIEGVSGRGDSFMVGKIPPQQLPMDVLTAVTSLYHEAESLLGLVEMEWVYDGTTTWIVQIHSPKIGEQTTVASAAEEYEPFDVSLGLDRLHDTIAKAKRDHHGVVLFGDVGITSHFGDLLRQARIPWRIEKPLPPIESPAR